MLTEKEKFKIKHLNKKDLENICIDCEHNKKCIPESCEIYQLIWNKEKERDNISLKIMEILKKGEKNDNRWC